MLYIMKFTLGVTGSPEQKVLRDFTFLPSLILLIQSLCNLVVSLEGHLFIPEMYVDKDIQQIAAEFSFEHSPFGLS